MNTDKIKESVFDRQYRAATFGVIIIVNAVAFESVGILTVLPVIAREQHGLNSYGWGVSALMLANIVGALFAGRASDRGRGASAFAIAVAMFVAGCLVAASSTTWPVLLIGRSVQGLGIGVVQSSATILIARRYPARLQPRMYAVLSSSYMIPALAGPPVAGMIAETFSWRWVFVLVTPIALVAGLLTTPALRRGAVSATRPGETRSWRQGFVLNTILLVVGTTVLLLALGTTSSLTLVPGVVLGLVIAVGGFQQVMPRGTLLAQRGVPAGVATRFFLCAAFFGTDAFLPLGLNQLRGLSPTLSGLGLAVAGLAWVGGSTVQVKLDRGNARKRARATARGAALVAVGVAIVSLAILTTLVPGLFALVGWAIGGFGMGMAYNACTSETMRLTPAETRGRTASSLTTAQTLATAVLAGLGGGLINLSDANGGTITTALTATFAVTMACAFVSIAVSSRLARPE